MIDTLMPQLEDLPDGPMILETEHWINPLRPDLSVFPDLCYAQSGEPLDRSKLQALIRFLWRRGEIVPPSNLGGILSPFDLHTLKAVADMCAETAVTGRYFETATCNAFAEFLQPEIPSGGPDSSRAESYAAFREFLARMPRIDPYYSKQSRQKSPALDYPVPEREQSDQVREFATQLLEHSQKSYRRKLLRLKELKDLSQEQRDTIESCEIDRIKDVIDDLISAGALQADWMPSKIDPVPIVSETDLVAAVTRAMRTKQYHEFDFDVEGLKQHQGLPALTYYWAEQIVSGSGESAIADLMANQLSDSTADAYGYGASGNLHYLSLLNSDPAAAHLLDVSVRHFMLPHRLNAHDYAVAAARERDLSLSELRNVTLPSFGFDQDGTATVFDGHSTIEVKITDDLELFALDAESWEFEPVAAIGPSMMLNSPKRSEPSELQILAAKLADLRESLRIALELDMALEQSWAVDHWREQMLGHPLMSRLCKRLGSILKSA